MHEIDILKEWEQPIKIAEMLINATYECKANEFLKAFGCPEKYNRPLYDVADLKEIAEHLLAYCKNYESENGQ